MSVSKQLPRAGALTLLGVATLTVMVGSAIVPSLNSIATAHGLEGEESWLVTLPALGVIVFGLGAGALIDRLGAWTALAIGLILYGALGFAGALIPSSSVLFIDRFLLGGTTALVMTAGTTLISEFYNGKARLAMIARQGMAIELGGVVFLVIGGTIAALGWRWPFAIYLLAWVFLLALFAFVPRVGPSAPRHDTARAAPVKARLSDIYIAACGSMVVFFVAFITLPGVLIGAGFGESGVGYYLACVSLVAVCAASVMPRLTGRLGARNLLFIAFVAYGGAHSIYAMSPGLPGLVVAAVLMGGGFGFSVPLVNHEVVERTTPAQRGKALAGLSMMIFAGQFLSSLVELLAPQAEQLFLLTSVLALALALGMLWMSRRSG